MEPIKYQAIGIIYSPFKQAKGTPIQATAAQGVKGQVEVFPEYAEGLSDLDGFSHIILLYHFHLAAPSSLTVKPFLDDKERGIFAIRGPSRPNPIGMSVVRLEKVAGNLLHVAELDIVDGTPLLDIKPYVPEFDAARATSIGWLDGRLKRLPETNDDGRFIV
jgi:tRNA (adenine37-N6)-methyltransferase